MKIVRSAAIACLLCALVTQISFAQKPPVKFGTVPDEDIRMTSYPTDTTASAVILADYGESNLVYKQGIGFSIEFERIKRVKILTKNGYDFANFSVPLYHSKNDDEKISGLKAVTYNLENGKVTETKMKSDAVFKEKVDDNVELMKFTLPNVKVGSVVDVTYKVHSPFLYNFQDWDFQSTIPTRYSEYRAHIPEYFDYKTYQQGYINWPIQEHEAQPKKITIQPSRTQSVIEGRNQSYEPYDIDYIENSYRWAVSDVPAFKEEPYMTTYRDFISSLNFELAHVRMPNQPVENYSSSWEEITNNFLESDNFGGVLKSSGFAKDIVTDLVKDKPEAAMKIAAIYGFVKQNVSWDGTTTKYPSKSLKKVLEEKKGNSADINLLLTALLQRADFDANPLLISTRDHGFTRLDVPASKQFNHALVHVALSDKYVLLDATDRSLPMLVLPANCLNGQGLLVSDKGGWVKISSSGKSRSVLNAELTLDAEGTLSGKVDFTHDGYEAQRVRKAFVKNGEAEYKKDKESSFGWEARSVSFSNIDQLGEPVKEQYEVTFNDYVQVAGDAMYVNPVFTFRMDENPFRLEAREYPVDFGSAQERFYTLKLVLPEGVVAEEIPQPKALLLPNKAGRFNFNVVQNGNTIMVVNQLIISQPMFPQTEYASLREFYAQVVAKHAEQIVLRRK